MTAPRLFILAMFLKKKSITRLHFTYARTIQWCFAGWLLFLAGCPGFSPPDLHPSIVEARNAAVTLGPSDKLDLIKRVDDVLAANRDGRRLSTDAQAAWQVLHGILAYGHELKINAAGTEVVAVDYLLKGGPVNGFELRLGDRFDVVGSNNEPGTARGIRAELDPGTKHGQGHRDQWLAYLSTCRLPATQSIQTLDGPSTVEMWLRQMEWDVPLNFEREFSWTLMSLGPYRKTTHRWTARDGKQYSIESLLQSEINQLSPDSACGGSHRLTAIARTLQLRRNEGAPITGVWADAEALLETALETAFEFQNGDGTLSNNYFERQGWSLDLSTAIGTTGHTLEFIANAGPESLLTDARVQRAANKLCEMLEQTIKLDLECGALYHALSGLRVYRERLTAITASS